MKFQNPSFKFFFEGTDKQTDRQTKGQAESNMLPLFQSWGHKNQHFSEKIKICYWICIIPASIAQWLEHPLQRVVGYRFDPRPHNTNGDKNGTVSFLDDACNKG